MVVHGLVHPDGIGDVEADGHAEFGGFFPDRVHARVIRMNFRRAGFSGAQALAFVVNFSDALCPGIFAALELFHGAAGKTGLVVGGEVQTAPEFETLGVLRVFCANGVEFFAGRHGQDHGFFNADLVHVFEPGADFGIGLGVRM